MALGWASRPNAGDERCRKCGRKAPELYQARRFVDRHWIDVPDMVLCASCFAARATRGLSGAHDAA
jgi:hypothetical protein